MSALLNHCFCAHADTRAQLGKRVERASFDSQATRRHFLTKQDLRNICRKLTSFSKHRHADDALCRLMRVSEGPHRCWFIGRGATTPPRGPDGNYRLTTDRWLVDRLSGGSPIKELNYPELVVRLLSWDVTGQS